MFSSSSRPIQPYESITPRPIPVGLIRWRSGFPKFNAMSSLGESSLPRPTYPESSSVTLSSTTKPPHPSNGDLRMLLIALNQSLNEPLTQCTSSIFTFTYDVPLSVNIPFGFRCLVSATVRADGPRLRLLSSSIGDFVFTWQRPNETDRQRSGGRGKGVSAPTTRFRRPDRGCDFRRPDFCQRILYVDRLSCGRRLFDGRGLHRDANRRFVELPHRASRHDFKACGASSGV